MITSGRASPRSKPPRRPWRRSSKPPVGPGATPVPSLLPLLPEYLRGAAGYDALPGAARELDRNYISTRYDALSKQRSPNTVPDGAPFEVYDADQSERAVTAVNRIVRFCERHVAGPEGGSAGPLKPQAAGSRPPIPR